MIDLLFVLGVILAPMTALRIFKFGPGEILLIIWMVLSIYQRAQNSKNRSFTLRINEIGKYQMANLMAMFIGMLVSMIIYHETESLSDILTSFFTHFFMFLLSSSMISYFENRDIEDINCILNKIVTWGALVYGILLLYATYISSALFGIRLWMGGKSRFLGLALNPHQISMITGAGLFYSLYLMSTSENFIYKLKYIILALIWFWVSLSLSSDTMTLCYVICFVLWLFLKVVKTGHSPILIKCNCIVVSVGILIAGMLLLKPLISVFMGFVTEAGNGLGRLELWSSGLSQFQTKILGLFTGLGPGGHTGQYMSATGHEAEAHNTYVQLILNSGVFICIYYIKMTLGLIKKPLYKNTYLVLAILYFVLYGFGGNMNRRVLVWFTYTMAWILFQKTKDTEISKR